MKIVFRSALIIFFLIGSLNFCITAHSQQTQSLGLIVPLSGDAAAIGDAIKNGAELAYSELSPDTKSKFNLVFEDDSLIPKNSVTAFQNLKNKNNLLAVVAVSSGVAHAIAPQAETNQLPFIGIGVSDAKVSAGRQYSFLHWITPEVQMQAILEELKNRNLNRLGLVIASQEGYYAMRDALKKLISGSSVSIITEEEMPQNEQDFGSYVVKINRAKELDAVFIALMPGQNAQFAKKLRQSGSKIQIIGGEVFDNPDEQAAAGTAFAGAFYATPAEANSNFLSSYKAKFPKASLFAAANGYDSVKLVAAYLENKNHHNRGQ